MALGALGRVAAGLLKGRRVAGAARYAGGALAEGTFGATPGAIRAGGLNALPAVALGTAGTAAMVGFPIKAHANKEKQLAAEVVRQERAWLLGKADQLQQRRLERDMAENAARLAALAPDVYNRVLAGRMLPRGAQVFGGQPDTQMLQELTYGMSTGQFQPPPVDDSDILAELAPK